MSALIFDMDGVLIDSEPLHFQAYQEFLRQHNVDFTWEDNRPFIGRKDLDLAAYLVERHDIKLDALEFLERKERIMESLISTDATAMPGVIAVLQAAQERALPMAVASSATLPTIELITTQLKISGYFQTLTSGDEVGHGKPDPDVYLLAAQRLGIPPQSCLVIEDSLNGILAAKAAGMKCIAVPCQTTRHQDHTKADKILGTLEDLNLDDWCKPRI